MTTTLTDGAPAPLTIRLFGAFEVRVNGAPLPRLRSRKGQWLLALLTLRHGTEVERSWLAGTLWPESGAPQAMHSLRISLADLRRALGEEAARLQSPRTTTLALDLSGAAADVLTFDAAIARGDCSSLEQAIALYRGPLLEECTQEWVFPERQAREQVYLQALERLAAYALARGDAAGAEGHLRRAVAVDPLRESAQRALMQALAAGGNTAAALLAYRELRLLLHRELNAEPDSETRALFQQIRAEAREKAGGATGTWSRPPSDPVALPEGTVTFLFTDIEGSTRLWEAHAEAMRARLVRHDLLLHRAIQVHGGSVFKTLGDGVCAAFPTAPDALAAAVAAQRALHAEAQGPIGPLRVRMALHTGTTEARDDDYFGPDLNRVARLLEAGHGGQILLSRASQELVCGHLAEGASLRYLGEHRFKDLSRPEHVFQAVVADLPADFPPLNSLGAYPNNLPIPLTSFIGREREMAAVRRQLSGARLVTLTGAGGCGKTRLALQVAADVVGEFADGAWLVELAALSDSSLVPQMVASALGVREEPGRPLRTTLIDSLRPRSLLLLLDNCEHLLGACAHLTEELLRSCPHLRVLATSREGLGITGETTYRVPSLSLPDPRSLPPTPDRLAGYEAIRLFVDRALLAHSSFTVTEQNATAIAQVCHRLDGIPLAIELAATRVKALPVETIAKRLDDRFRLLTGGSRTALPRQQTLRALIDWSYGLLTEPERVLLRRLAVFAGGFSLEAAEEVCSGGELSPEEVLDRLTALVEKSLVVYEEGGGAGGAGGAQWGPAPGRYRLLETVRQYSRDRLLEAGEAESVRKRHRDWCLALAEQAEPELRGPEQVAWLDRLEMEHDNFRAALEWCQPAKDGGAAELRLVGALCWFWLKRGYTGEGRQRIEEALCRSSGAPAACRVKALHGAGVTAYFQGDYAAANSFGEECLALARRAGDKWSVARSLFHLGMLAMGAGNYERATALAEECLARAREVGDPWLLSHALMILGIVAHTQGDYERATPLLEDALALAREVGDWWLMAYMLLNLGEVTLSQGDGPRARRLYCEGLARFRQLEHRRGIAWCLAGLAGVAAAEGQVERAAELLGTVDHVLGSIGLSLPSPVRPNYKRTVTAVRAALGEEAFAAAWAEGRAMPLEQAVRYALEETSQS